MPHLLERNQAVDTRHRRQTASARWAEQRRAAVTAVARLIGCLCRWAEWHEGEWEGQGKCTYADGAVYEGEWHEGKPRGQGKCTYADSAVYEGNWHEGKPHGHGKFTLV